MVAMMMGPNGRALPIAVGASASADVGGNRGEQITGDAGNRPANPKVESIQEPKDDAEEFVQPPVPPAAAVEAPAVAPKIEVQGSPTAAVADDEIDKLHERFDAMEASIKRRLAVATLHARFDALEAWLHERFPG